MQNRKSGKAGLWKIVFLAALMVLATTITALAATSGATWTKVKLTKKCQAHWNVKLEDAKKRDVHHYELKVYVSDTNASGSADWDLWDTIDTEDNTRHEKLAVTEGGTYKFKVRAIMNDGSVTAWSQDSNAVTLTTEKAQKLHRKAVRAARKEARAARRAKKRVTNADGSLKRGWELSDGVWKYYDKNGDEAVGWLYVKGNWYYLDEDGEMMTGWIRNNGKEYYLDENGAMTIGEAHVDGKAHSFDASGAKTDQTQVDEIEIEDTEVTDVTVETEAAETQETATTTETADASASAQ
ncbi:MAG: hypothetical protein IJU30_05465 [Lachnospiraceae bacterium]|nr:hypothetical protein [Lachnospiraceae bacterium]